MTTSSSTPIVTAMQVIPVAGHDSMLMNLMARTRRTSPVISLSSKITPGTRALAKSPAAKDPPDPGRRRAVGGG